MLDSDTKALLEGGCALIVGLALADGEPLAMRGWGIDVLTEDPLRVRLVIDAGETLGIEALVEGAEVAITSVDVFSLRAVQLKGRADAVAAASAQDRARAEKHYRELFANINANDGTPVSLLERMVPTGFAACTVVIDALFDQTPGPKAGTPLSSAR